MENKLEESSRGKYTGVKIFFLENKKYTEENFDMRGEVD